MDEVGVVELIEMVVVELTEAIAATEEAGTVLATEKDAVGGARIPSIDIIPMAID